MDMNAHNNSTMPRTMSWSEPLQLIKTIFCSDWTSPNILSDPCLSKSKHIGSSNLEYL